VRKVRKEYRIAFGNLKGKVYLEYLFLDGRRGMNW
jgi:hypothetical protein